ncbi:MAG: hypothetical protein JW913_15885 [Chitinispirillaceae bacterium]|nr:hypothetical protein [Chitinispirillaceae bacterium]
MQHTSPRRGTAKSSYVQAILLLVFLALGILGYKVLKKGGFTSGLNAFINMDVKDFRSLQSMKEEQKLSLQKSFGGFWVNRTADPDALIRKNDRLELRDNGIIWQVVHWLVLYPCGDTGSYYHIRHGYLNPYSVAADRRSIVCEVRTIRQIFIYGADTCFGRSQVDELWQTRKEDSLLVMNRKRYLPYHGELSDFFPEGMIDLIDKPMLKDCEHNLDLAHIVRNRLAGCYQNNKATRTCDTVVIKEELSEYFKSAFVDEIFTAIPYFPKLPDSMSLPIKLKHDGTITLDLSKGARARADHFEARILDQIEAWPLPRCDARGLPVFRYQLHIPPP